MPPEPHLLSDPLHPDVSADTAPTMDDVLAALACNEAAAEPTTDERLNGFKRRSVQDAIAAAAADERHDVFARDFMRKLLVTITCTAMPEETAFALRIAVQYINGQPVFVATNYNALTFATAKWVACKQRPLVVDTMADDTVGKLLQQLAAEDDVRAFEVLRKRIGKLTWAHDVAAMAERMADNHAGVPDGAGGSSCGG